MIGKAFVAHVNKRSSNHDPNHVLDRVLKRLSERDSSPCKHTHCYTVCNVAYIVHVVNVAHIYDNCITSGSGHVNNANIAVNVTSHLPCMLSKCKAELISNLMMV